MLYGKSRIMNNKQACNKVLSRRKVLKCGLYGGLATGLSPYLWLSGCSGKRFGKMPNVIIIVMDTTRIDRLNCYGYRRRPTSQSIVKLAQDSLVYTRATAPSSWTLPSHASLFTGKFASSHGAQYDPKGPFVLIDAIKGPPDWDRYRVRGLAKDEVTLAMILKQAGYTTGAVVAAIWLKKVFGLNKGFDYYDDSGIETFCGRIARHVTDSAVSWIEKTGQKKFFLFLNYFDPHGTYMPPEGFAAAFLPKDTQFKNRKPTVEELNALYDSEILYMDYYIGQLLTKLKEYNLYDDTLIIATADHGELLGEHGKFTHGHYLYQEEIHIPLLIKYPHKEVLPARTAARIQLTDIIALILERLGMDLPDGVHGNIPPDVGHPIFSEVYPLPMESPDGYWRAIYDENFKFIWNSKGRHLLFNLEDDPGEKVNLFGRQQQRAAQMLSKLERYLEGLPTPGPVGEGQQLDEETKKVLKSLGYVD